MTTQDARERAAQTVANARAIYQRIASEGAPGYWSGSMIDEWEEKRAVRRDAAWADLEAAMKREDEERIAALVAKLTRARGIIDHGVEMVGPEPYSFTKDEVIEEAALAIDAALRALADSEDA